MMQGAPQGTRCLGLHRFHRANLPGPNTFAGTTTRRNVVAHPSRRGLLAAPQDEVAASDTTETLMVRRREAPSRTMRTGALFKKLKRLRTETSVCHRFKADASRSKLIRCAESAPMPAVDANRHVDLAHHDGLAVAHVAC